MKMIIDGHEIESYFDENEVDAKTCAKEPQHNPNYKNFGSKTYELIIPKFPPYEKIYSGCCLLEENIKNGFPFYATIMVYDDSLQGEIVDQEDYFIEITHKVADEDNISQSEYNDMIHELQLAYAKCVFKTLFKEVIDE